MIAFAWKTALGRKETVQDSLLRVRGSEARVGREGAPAHLVAGLVRATGLITNPTDRRARKRVSLRGASSVSHHPAARSPCHLVTPSPPRPLTASPFHLLSPLLLACFLLAPVAAWADRKEAAPEALTQVGITEHLDAKLPLDLPLVDSSGKPVRLGEFFDGRRPVILTMNYSNCPMLCSLQLNGLSRGLEALDWNIGDKFQLITVSIDPLEAPARAEQTKQKYLTLYGRAGAAGGWHFLTGEEANIRRLAGTVGFGYSYLPETKQYAHAAAVMICTPDGRVSRYLYGIEYPAQSLRLALLEASEGKIGSTMDQVLLFCFHYDPQTQRYAPAAVRIMKAGGLATVLLVGGLLAVYWRREARQPKAGKSEAAS